MISTFPDSLTRTFRGSVFGLYCWLSDASRHASGLFLLVTTTSRLSIRHAQRSGKHDLAERSSEDGLTLCSPLDAGEGGTTLILLLGVSEETALTHFAAVVTT